LLDAQNAQLLLSGCRSTALTYNLKVTPPRLAAAAAQALDDAMDDARARILNEPSVVEGREEPKFATTQLSVKTAVWNITTGIYFNNKAVPIEGRPRRGSCTGFD
jgi:hypothetical protein